MTALDVMVVDVAGAAEGIGLEETALRGGVPCVLLWRAQTPSIVVPRTRAREPGFAALCDTAARAGWPLELRSSGGGAVPQGPSTLNLAIVAPRKSGATIEDGYRALCGAIADGLARFGVNSEPGGVAWSFCDGAWNMTAGGRKFAGTAQRWRAAGGTRAVMLLHAALVMQMPPDTAWPVLDAVERGGAAKAGVRKDVHVSVSELIGPTYSQRAVSEALGSAAHAQLRSLVAAAGDDGG